MTTKRETILSQALKSAIDENKRLKVALSEEAKTSNALAKIIFKVERLIDKEWLRSDE